MDLWFPYHCGSTHHSKKQQQLALSYYQVLGPPHGGLSFPAINSEAVAHYLTSSFLPAPTHVVYNEGLWLRPFADYMDILDQIMTGAAVLKERHNATMFWKTTTIHSDGAQMMYDEEKHLAQEKGMQVHDISHLSLVAYQQGLTVHWDKGVLNLFTALRPCRGICMPARSAWPHNICIY